MQYRFHMIKSSPAEYAFLTKRPNVLDTGIHKSLFIISLKLLCDLT